MYVHKHYNAIRDALDTLGKPYRFDEVYALDPRRNWDWWAQSYIIIKISCFDLKRDEIQEALWNVGISDVLKNRKDILAYFSTTSIYKNMTEWGQNRPMVKILNKGD